MSLKLASATAALVLAGCQFDPTGTSDPADPGDLGDVSEPDDGGDDSSEEPPTDLDPPRLDAVSHLPFEAWFAGTAEVVLSGGTIDTDRLTLPIELPDGAVFDMWPQQLDGPEVAVLHVARLEVMEGGAVRVIGSRPLIAIAAGEIAINGLLDAGARGPLPGAGGSHPASGVGLGGTGDTQGDRNGGGGGAGGADRGANGGDSTRILVRDAAGGTGGGPNLVADRDVLIGGSGGGLGGGCATEPGAGGGAVQLSAGEVVAVRGAINAGGGGGGGGLGGGDDRDDCGGIGSGAGGGAGGAIFIEAPGLNLNNELWVNGGGGGGSGGDDGSGGVGSDGAPGALVAAGGVGGADGGADGGAGAIAGVLAATGASSDSGDGGGGGGSAGSLVVE